MDKKRAGNEFKKASVTVAVTRCRIVTGTYILTHAHHDPVHCCAHGLFRSLGPGDRKGLKIDITYLYGDSRIEFKLPEPLGAIDLRVLQGLVALAGKEGKSFSLLDEPETNVGAELKSRLVIEPGMIYGKTLDVKFSYRALAKEIGYARHGSENTKPLQRSVERFFMSAVFVQAPNGRRDGFHLLSRYTSAEGDAYIALNPLLALAVAGMGRHVHIDMDEVRALKSDPARLIHQRLCAWIDPGKSGSIGMTKLCEYAWPEDAKTKSAQRKREQRSREALDELKPLKWKIVETANGTFEIKRPKLKDLNN
ncbi:MAG: replication protein C [Clostridiales bacterium]|jgi:hypothetical protein|nr:replication protein C [Clostridiales bacterium]